MSAQDTDCYRLDAELQQTVNNHHERFRGDIQSMQKAIVIPEVDLEPVYRLDHLLKTQPELLPEFENDPAQFAMQRVGFQLPAGCQIHFIDSKGKYRPEADAATQRGGVEAPAQRPWARTEIRIGIQDAAGTGTIVLGFGDPPAGAIIDLPSPTNK